MSSRNAILKLQRAWALTAGRLVDARGYVPTIQENLRQPLSPGTERALTQGSGSELRETRNRPAKMRALHSSAALVVNIFDYWTLRDKAPLAAALGLEEQIISIEFEAQFPTHLDGKPPNLDLAIQT